MATISSAPVDRSELIEVLKCLGDTADPRRSTFISGGAVCTMHKLSQDTLLELDRMSFPIGVRKDSTIVHERTKYV